MNDASFQITRKQFFGIAAAAVATTTSGCVTTSAAPRNQRVLIRNASLLTMDPQLGEIARGDLLVDGDKIAAIGRDLPTEGAEVIDASGMILMPGLIDGHRHVWQSVLNGALPKTSPRYRDYDRQTNMIYALCFDAEDMDHAQYMGGLACLDTGVTTVVDQMHAANGDDMEQAAAMGLIRSGVAGVFCYQLRNGPFYGRGDTYAYSQALADRNQPADARHWRNAEVIRDRYFSSDSALLGFGIGLSGSVGSHTVEDAAMEFRRARTLSPRILTQHMNQRPGTQLPVLRGVSDLRDAGVLGPDYLISHGVDVTDDELLMLKDAGSGVCATVIGESTYAKASIHGRAYATGVNTSIGLDVGIAVTHDYFEQVRMAYWTLHRTAQGREIAASMEAADMLAMATSVGARAVGLGGVAGSLTVGYRADMILLRTGRLGFSQTGPLTDRVVASAVQTDIDSVWVAGKARKRSGALVDVDSLALAQKSERVRERVLERASTIVLI